LVPKKTRRLAGHRSEAGRLTSPALRRCWAFLSARYSMIVPVRQIT
jgi:hypothetical protein